MPGVFIPGKGVDVALHCKTRERRCAASWQSVRYGAGLLVDLTTVTNCVTLRGDNGKRNKVGLHTGAGYSE